MIRTNLCTKPTETLDALDGDPSDWRTFKNGSMISLQPGQYVLLCNVTERGSKGALIQFWDEDNNHPQFIHDSNANSGVNENRIYVQIASNKCHFSVCGCRVTDFLVERADTYDAAVRGGGFRASSRATPCRKSVNNNGFEVAA